MPMHRVEQGGSGRVLRFETGYYYWLVDGFCTRTDYTLYWENHSDQHDSGGKRSLKRADAQEERCSILCKLLTPKEVLVFGQKDYHPASGLSCL